MDRTLGLNENELTSLPANVFDKNTALEYACPAAPVFFLCLAMPLWEREEWVGNAFPSFWAGYNQSMTCVVCFAGG